MLKKRSGIVWNARTIVMLALMISISIVLTRYLSVNVGGFFRLSLGSIATILTGLWFGPAAGLAAGASADIIGLMIAPSGVWLPLITVSAGMWGLLPAFLSGFISGSRKRKIIVICIIVVITSVICQLILTTTALITVYGTGIIPSRLIQFFCSTPVYCAAVSTLYLSPLTKMAGVFDMS